MLVYGGNDIEVSCVVATKVVLRELSQIFPEEKNLEDVIVVPTCQKSAMELVNWGDDSDVEKDRLLEVFVGFAKEVCDTLIAEGFWADYVDPCSGLPSIAKNTPTVYDEVASMQTLLKYNVQDAGPCKILLHPKWGSAVYPATLFTNAPQHNLTEVLKKYHKT